MQVDWEPLEFATAERNGVPLLRGIDEIQTVLDDHISKTQAIRSSPFCKPFEEEVHAWEATLMYIQDFIDQVIALQRSWMALEPIFASDDIKRQLPQESESFARIDSNFRMRMQQVDSNKPLRKEMKRGKRDSLSNAEYARGIASPSARSRTSSRT